MHSLLGSVAIGLVVTLTLSTAEDINVAGLTPSEKFEHATQLDNDGKYFLFWNYNATHVTFEVHVNTKGYVGFGISENGKMVGSDVVIGWVMNNGTTYFADRHATGHVMPPKDSHQDWHLLYSAENDFGTVLKFVRKIDTCDKMEDKVIQEGAVRVIYSYHPVDPVSEDNIPYHLSTRGVKSVYLLGNAVVPTTMPSDVKYFDFLNANVLLPAQVTTYNCIGFQFPDIGGKHHMIKFEPVITPGNEANVHHILIYQCSGIDPSIDGVSGHCYDNRPRNLPWCRDSVIVWLVGGQAFHFPHDVGYSMGGRNDASFFIMETHYDNQGMKSGILDNSGIRITLTKTLRPIESGLLWFGQAVDFHQIIPPHQENFLSRGYCSENCLTQAMSDINTPEIKVFAAVEHSHLLSTSMITRHFRNGTEIQPLIEDPNYDFAFQDLRVFQDHVSIKQGDSIMVDCIYNSTMRTGPTFGGLGTPEEMCVTFAFYYPRMNMVQCISTSTLDNMGVKSSQLYMQIMEMDWTDPAVAADFTAKLQHSNVEHYCFGGGFNNTQEDFVEPPIQHPYMPPASTCP